MLFEGVSNTTEKIWLTELFLVYKFKSWPKEIAWSVLKTQKMIFETKHSS